VAHDEVCVRLALSEQEQWSLITNHCCLSVAASCLVWIHVQFHGGNSADHDGCDAV